MRVLVCGSRDFSASGMVYAALTALLDQFGDDLELICGMCPTGADAHAVRWCEAHGVPLHRFYPDWERLGKRAGPVRNMLMLTEGQPDLVLAFIDDLAASKGTAHMVSIAKAAGVDVRVVRHATENA